MPCFAYTRTLAGLWNADLRAPSVQVNDWINFPRKPLFSYTEVLAVDVEVEGTAPSHHTHRISLVQRFCVLLRVFNDRLLAVF